MKNKKIHGGRSSRGRSRSRKSPKPFRVAKKRKPDEASDEESEGGAEAAVKKAVPDYLDYSDLPETEEEKIEHKRLQDESASCDTALPACACTPPSRPRTPGGPGT